MAGQMGLIPRLRERISEIRERVGLRAGGRGQIQIGKGALIERSRELVSRGIERIQELRPGIVPKVGEVLSEWYPGKRLIEIVSPKTAEEGARGEVVKAGEMTYKEVEVEKPKPERKGYHV